LWGPPRKRRHYPDLGDVAINMLNLIGNLFVNNIVISINQKYVVNLITTLDIRF